MRWSLGGGVPKIASKSVRKEAKMGGGTFKVGEKTMPTFLTVILFSCELLTTPIRNADKARIKVQLGSGRWCTRTL